MTDFTMYAGDTKRLNFTVKDKDGVAVNIVGASIRWWLANKDWKTAADPAAAIVLRKSTGDSPPGIDVSNTATGLFTVHLSSDDTESLLGGYVHEAEVVLASGDVGTVEQSKAKFLPQIIKPSGS